MLPNEKRPESRLYREPSICKTARLAILTISNNLIRPGSLQTEPSLLALSIASCIRRDVDRCRRHVFEGLKSIDR